MVSSYGVGIMGSTNESNNAKESAFNKVAEQFGSLPYNCAFTDQQIKKITDKIIEERKKSPIPNLQQKAYIEALENKKGFFESTFETKSCRDIIEEIRLTTGAVESSKFAIKAEQQILPKNEKDQNLYIGLGAVVMLIGLYIVLKE